MLWLPTASAVVLQLATELLMAPVHKVLPALLKVTVPVGLTAFVSVAVSVTEAPNVLVLVLALLVSVTVGVAAASISSRDWLGAAAVEPLAPLVPAARAAVTPHN